MDVITVCHFQYSPECNIFHNHCVTGFTEETIFINSDLIESVVAVEIPIWYSHITEELVGWFWKSIRRTGRTVESHKETFYKLTMASGQYFFTQNNCFSELLCYRGK